MGQGLGRDEQKQRTSGEFSGSWAATLEHRQSGAGPDCRSRGLRGRSRRAPWVLPYGPQQEGRLGRCGTSGIRQIEIWEAGKDGIPPAPFPGDRGPASLLQCWAFSASRGSTPEVSPVSISPTHMKSPLALGTFHMTAFSLQCMWRE